MKNRLENKLDKLSKTIAQLSDRKQRPESGPGTPPGGTNVVGACCMEYGCADVTKAECDKKGGKWLGGTFDVNYIRCNDYQTVTLDDGTKVLVKTSTLCIPTGTTP